MIDDKKDNSLVKRSHRIIKMGDDLVKVDDRNRVIGKVSLDDARNFISESDLDERLKTLVTKKDLASSNFVTKEELSKYTPDLSKYLRKDDANVRFVLSKAMSKYPTTAEVDEKIKSQKFTNLVKYEDLKKYADKESLNKLVTKEELATIVSPALLAKLATKSELAAYLKKEDLKDLAARDEALLKSAKDQKISGGLHVSGDFTVNGEKVKVASEKEQCSIRLINSAPAKLTEDDEYVIIMNETSDLFGVLLPAGKKGLKFIIKDGTGSSYHAPIQVASSVKQTIDGRENVQLNKPYGVLKLIYNGREWNIV